MEQTNEDLTPTIKCENEAIEMDIEGSIINVELKPQLSQIQRALLRTCFVIEF